MKIAIASDDGKTISSHFGRTRGFVIFEIEGMEIKKQEYRDNTFTGHARGLEGSNHSFDRHAPILEALSDCGVVISHGMGRRIYDDLSNAKIEAFITEIEDVENALKLFLNGNLVNRPELGCSHNEPEVK
ncbi:MAG TPA: NifB/NifX family molybdenum-iron cluster-binding protein [bacterium]